MTQDFAKRKSRLPKPRPTKKTVPEKTAKKSVKRKNTRKEPNPSKKAPVWAWLLIGLFVAAFAMFLVHLSKQATTEKTTEVNTERPTKTAQEQQSQVRFDFYKILREQEIEVDTKIIGDTLAGNDFHNVLQAGSFKKYIDADKRRAKLLLLNLPANIETITNNQQQKWHRVIVGPFTSRAKVAKARSILASHQINSLLLKRKP
ncbi:hypothetical protein AB835_07140 [Candidatus Endobugula sertula]|uniref:SPOR domain-containing protein n=1 Tax=Candidatus Endobugula sertula TaxID=62101 RepID=A0A1D2QQ77_9GAMM|nr:hypothetical protein AB835_07140 [Candidatus Endobugula sertula]